MNGQIFLPVFFLAMQQFDSARRRLLPPTDVCLIVREYLQRKIKNQPAIRENGIGWVSLTWVR